MSTLTCALIGTCKYYDINVAANGINRQINTPHLLQATLQTGFPGTLRPLTPQPPAHKWSFSEEEMAYQAGMGGMVGRGRGGMWGQWVLLDYVERKETWGERGEMEHPAPRGQWEKKAIVETQVCLDLKEPRAHQQEGQSTLAGGGPPVPVARELNCCTQEELEGLVLDMQVEQPTFCACQTILNTHDMAEESVATVH